MRDHEIHIIIEDSIIVDDKATAIITALDNNYLYAYSEAHGSHDDTNMTQDN